MPNELEVLVSLGSDEERSSPWLLEQTTRLRRELRGFAQLRFAEREGSEPAEGERGESPEALRDLCVVIPAAAVALRSLVDAVKDWSARNRGQKVNVEIDGDRLTLDGADDEQVRDLITVFTTRHAKGGPPGKGKH